MRASTLLLSLVAFATGQAVAARTSMMHNHAMAHKRMHEMDPEQEFEKRGNTHLSAADLARLKSLGFCEGGVNSESDTDGVWIGKSGPYKNTFINRAGEDIILVVWGPEGSWVNSKQPDITVTIPAGKKKTLSFSSTASGAWAAIDKDTKLVNGQVCQTWGEYTFGPYGTVDVSREVNMNGRPMSIHGPQCTSDMEKCVFVCPNGQESCWQDYQLQNCKPGSQQGANYGNYGGMPSGGCSGMGNSAHLRTIIG